MSSGLLAPLNEVERSIVICRVKALLTAVAAIFAATAFASKPAIVDGLTFFNTGDKLFVPVRDVARQFGWSAGFDAKTKRVVLNNRTLNAREVRKDINGKPIVSLQELGRNGISVSYDKKGHLYELHKKIKPRQMFYVRRGMKRVVVNKRAKMLAAWQGNRLVMRSNVTYGVAAKQTPNGIFKAQAYRNVMHRSRLYKQAEMPYAVNIVGNIFIHGFKSVPTGAGSHGCIRLPIKKAQWFYYWIQRGTPVTIMGKWPRGAA